MAKGNGRRKMGRDVIVKGAPEAAAPQTEWKPYRDGAEQVENYIEMSESDRVYQSLWCENHQVTDFVMIQQIKNKSRWTDVVKVDCCHLEVHAHHRRKNDSEDRKVLQVIEGPSDIRIGLDKANDLIFKHWKNNLRRWHRGN
jgi:hypothetical protein